MVNAETVFRIFDVIRPIIFDIGEEPPRASDAGCHFNLFGEGVLRINIGKQGSERCGEGAIGEFCLVRSVRLEEQFARIPFADGAADVQHIFASNTLCEDVCFFIDLWIKNNLCDACSVA